MIWIELIGPAGVGKSFIFNALRSTYSQFRPFEHIPVSPPVLGILSRNNALRRWVHTLNIQRKMRNFRMDYNRVDEETISVFWDAMDVFTNSSVVKLELARYFHYRLREVKFHEKVLDDSGLFFSEDGLIHLLILGLNPDNIRRIRKPDVLICLDASEIYIRENRVRRIQQGRPSLVEKSMSEDQLIHEFFPKNYRLYREKAKVLKDHYGPKFFEINVEDSPAQKTVDEIKSIYSSLVSMSSASK